MKEGKIYQNMTELIGETPLMKLNRLMEKEALPFNLFAKLEAFNPAGSAKDRVALAMILDAEEKGRLKPGGTVIEPTSGNTGIGLAAVCAARGYHTILTMPETMSIERRNLLKAYGAEVVLTAGAKGMQGAIDKADALAAEIPGSIVAGQFVNPANPRIHEATTGPEIWTALAGKVDMFLAGIGTGGTITGVGRYLKKQNPKIKIIGIEPAGSPLLTTGKAGPHGLQGIGANFVPPVLDRAIYDAVITVTEEEAYQAGRKLAHSEGMLVGITSGAVLHAAMVEGRRSENARKNIVAFLPDTGERYLSTPMFTEAAGS